MKNPQDPYNNGIFYYGDGKVIERINQDFMIVSESCQYGIGDMVTLGTSLATGIISWAVNGELQGSHES